MKRFIILAVLMLFSTTAHAARLAQSGFELDSLTVDMEFRNVTNSPTIQTGTVRSGTYALEVNTSSATAYVNLGVFASNQNVAGFARKYIYISSLPSTNSGVIAFQNSSDSSVAILNLLSTGVLQIRNSSNTVIGTDSSPLSTGQWYMLELENDASTNPGTLTARLNSVQFSSAANNVQGGWTQVRIGTSSTTTHMFFDDVAINDSSGSYQNSWPGSGKIIHLRPNAAGEFTQWTPDSGSNYARVNEVTPDGATSYVSDVTLNHNDFYDLSDSGMGACDVINVVAVGGRFADATADATTAFKFQIENDDGEGVVRSGAIIPNSTTYKTNATAAPYTYPLIMYKDPSAQDWTTAKMNSLQIGNIISAAGTYAIRLSAIWASIDYKPASCSAGSGGLMMMGVGN